MVVIDTDVLIYFLRASKEVVCNIEAILQTEKLGISIITLAEIYEGFFSQSETMKTKLEHFEKFKNKHLTVINLDDDICKAFGKLRNFLRNKNKLIDNFDLLIAATCITYNLPLYTKNFKHFKKIDLLTLYE